MSAELTSYVKPLAVVLWLAAALVDAVGVRLIVRGARAAGRPDQSLTVIRGFRRLILGGGLICFGLGFWFGMGALHLLGAVFLAEEAVETQIMKWAAGRRGRRTGAREPGGDDSC
jgi:hypothetical protein